MQRLISEGIATFMLIFIGTGAATVNELTGEITHVGVALSFGLIVTVMIYALGDVSGAHMNPAVTIGFACAGRFPWKDVTGYIAAQCLGAIVGSTALCLLFMESKYLGASEPSGSMLQSLVLEAILTFILMFVILCVTAQEEGMLAGVVIGLVITFEAMMGGPISGASMNPARLLGPALLSGRLDTLWIYLIGPTLGAMFAVPVYEGMLAAKNSEAEEEEQPVELAFQASDES